MKPTVRTWPKQNLQKNPSLVTRKSCRDEKCIVDKILCYPMSMQIIYHCTVKKQSPQGAPLSFTLVAREIMSSKMTIPSFQKAQNASDHKPSHSISRKSLSSSEALAFALSLPFVFKLIRAG